MNAIKKVWVTPDDDLFSLSMESETVEPEYMRLKVRELAFPAEPTPEHPLRHTIVLGCLNKSDLWLIYQTIGKALSDG